MIPLWWDWIRSRRDSRSWAILGKGPTFSQRHAVDWSQHQTIGLNHVIREQDVTVAHAVDFEVIDQVPLSRWMAAEIVVFPWRMQLGCTTHEDTLPRHARRSPTLRKLLQAGKVHTYNLAPGGRPTCSERFGRPVGVRYFSSEAAFNLLVGAGIKRVSLCGIDGRDTYAPDFRDLRPLANGRKSFDAGIAELARLAAHNECGVDRLPFPLPESPPARLYRDLMLAVPSYGSTCHGRDALPILQRLDARSVVDVGCGKNDFARELRRRGVAAWGVDPACPWADGWCEADRLPFHDGAVDWLTSFDVLEHIDRRQLPAVFAEFARVARRGWVLSISHRESRTPGPAGEKLHLTVEPESWWRDRIEPYATVLRDGPYLVCRLENR